MRLPFFRFLFLRAYEVLAWVGRRRCGKGERFRHGQGDIVKARLDQHVKIFIGADAHHVKLLFGYRENLTH